MDPLPFLTREWLVTQALPQTLERGAGYYQKGRIISVKLRTNVIEGEVQGSQRYRQTIAIAEDQSPIATCTCPYDTGGICKHLVAVAMAVIDGHVEYVVEEGGELVPHETDFYAQTFLSSPEGMQQAFLFQAFARNIALRRDFLRYQQPPPEQHLIDLRDVREKIRDSLLYLVIAPDEVESRMSRKSDWEETAEQLLRHSLHSLFAPFQAHIQRKLQLGDWLNAHRIWIAMYEGIAGIERPDDLDLLFPDEYSSYLRWEWNQSSDLILHAVSREIFGPGMVRQLVTLFCDRWSYYETSAGSQTPPIRIALPDFEAWLTHLAADPLSATFLRQRVDAFGWKLPRLTKALDQLLGP